MVGNGVCQCLRVPSSRANLETHNVKFEEVSSTCDGGKVFNLPVSLDQVFQEKEVDLIHLLEIEVLDYVCQSTNSCPSPNQPGHGSCTCMDLTMWTVDPRARAIINEART